MKGTAGKNDKWRIPSSLSALNRFASMKASCSCARRLRARNPSCTEQAHNARVPSNCCNACAGLREAHRQAEQATKPHSTAMQAHSCTRALHALEPHVRMACRQQHAANCTTRSCMTRKHKPCRTYFAHVQGHVIADAAHSTARQVRCRRAREPIPPAQCAAPTM